MGLFFVSYYILSSYDALLYRRCRLIALSTDFPVCHYPVRILPAVDGSGTVLPGKLLPVLEGLHQS